MSSLFDMHVQVMATSLSIYINRIWKTVLSRVTYVSKRTLHSSLFIQLSSLYQGPSRGNLAVLEFELMTLPSIVQCPNH